MIKISNFKKKYRAFELRIDKLDIDGVLVIKGDNGSGKTTLLRSIMRFTRFSGKIKGKSKLLTNIDYPGLFKPIDFNWLYSVKPDKKYKDLSKGNKQLLKIKIAFLYDNILLDEPIDGLDSNNREYLLNRIKDSSKTIVITTHTDYFDDFEIYRI